jgi:ankyrin repeat protein
MIAKVQDILSRCEKTASWEGLKISDLSQRNSIGDTPLHTVCTWGEVESTKRLLAAGAKVNALGDRGCTPLFNAVMGGSAAVVKTLLDAGGDVSIRSADGWLLVDYAKNTRAPVEVIALLERASRVRRQ